MENTSKALMIAGEILIAVLILSVLAAAYINLSGYMNSKEELKNQSQKEDFNEQFYIYQEDSYGSEILSLANKIQDYNIRESEDTDKGYERVDIIITFKKSYYKTYSSVVYGFKKGTYTTDQIVAEMKKLTDKIDSYGNYKCNGYTVSKLAYLRTNDQEQIIEDSGLTDSQKEKIKKYIKYYLALKNIELEIKAKEYKYVGSTYDDFGRITSIKYTEK